jgi:putative ABC transport system permease protein
VVSVLGVKLRRDLVRHKAQFASVALVIGLGVAVFGATYDAYRNLDGAFTRFYTQTAFADATATGGNSSVIADTARGDPGRPAVVLRHQADLPFRVAGSHVLLGRIISVPPGQSKVDGLKLMAGRLLTPGDRDAALLERHVADHFGLRPGSRIDIAAGGGGWRPVRVAGVVASPEYLFPARSSQDLITTPEDFGVAFAPETMVAAIPGSAEQVLVRATDRAAAPALVRAFTAQAQRHGAVVVTEAAHPSATALRQDVDAFATLAVLFPVLFILAAGLGAYVLLSRLVQAQRPLIGTFAAAGLPARRIRRHYLSFGLVTAAAGTAAGILAGLPLAWWVTGEYAGALGLPVDIPFTVRPATLLAGAAAGIAVGAVASWVPARAATRISPAAAMRASAPAARGRTSVLERLPGARRLPVRWRMVLRSFGRSPRRSLTTIAGVAAALVLILTSAGMRDTAKVLLPRQFTDIQRQNAQVLFTGRAGTAVLDRLRAIPGVAAAELAARQTVTVVAGSRQFRTELLAFQPHTAMHGFLMPDGNYRSLPHRGVSLGAALADRLSLHTGDTIILDLPTGPARDRVAGFVNEPFGTYAYTSLPHLRQIAPGTGPNVALIKLTSGADRLAVRQAATALPGVAGYADMHAIRDSIARELGIFDLLVLVMLAFGCALAAVLVLTAMTANAAERAAELGGLRAAGMPRRMLGRLITAENLLLTLAAVPIGLVLGVLVARGFMSSYNNELYRFSLQLRPWTLPAAAVIVLLAAALAQIPALRTVAHLDIARIVRERSL